VKLKLNNVRLSFPALVKPRGFDENAAEEDKRYESTFLLDKTQHAATIKEIHAAAMQMLKDKYGANPPKGFKLGLRDGTERPDTNGYGDAVMFIGANNKNRPVLVDQRVQPVAIDKINQVFYAGCFVNASVRLWLQDNKWGKRINCEVLALQKYCDGEPFGEAPVDANVEFEAVEDDGTFLGGDDDDGGLL
jgi:hypothetical protein